MSQLSTSESNKSTTTTPTSSTPTTTTITTSGNSMKSLKSTTTTSNKNNNKNNIPKQIEHKRANQVKLHEYSTATLGAGNMLEAVKLPKGEDPLEWLAVNVVDFFNEISLLYGIITEYCTEENCPLMSAGPKYEYLWMDGVKFKRPIKVSAPKYIDYLMSWVEAQINDPLIFPVEEGVKFPKDFRTTCKTILKRLFRVYGHIYYSHISKVTQLDCEAHLNTCFKHFIYFVREFNLVNSRELAPLEDTIQSMLEKDTQRNVRYQARYNYE